MLLGFWSLFPLFLSLSRESVFVIFAYGSLIVVYLVLLFRALRCLAVTLGDGFCDSVTWYRIIMRDLQA